MVNPLVYRVERLFHASDKMFYVTFPAGDHQLCIISVYKENDDLDTALYDIV